MSDIQMQIWEIILQKISRLISEQGKKPVVINIDARKNIREQLAMYKEMCEQYKNVPEIIVTTSMPDGELMFWVSQDAEFCIDDSGKVKTYGNLASIKKIAG